jgi:hypothetical protein
MSKQLSSNTVSQAELSSNVLSMLVSKQGLREGASAADHFSFPGFDCRLTIALVERRSITAEGGSDGGH